MWRRKNLDVAQFISNFEGDRLVLRVGEFSSSEFYLPLHYPPSGSFNTVLYQAPRVLDRIGEREQVYTFTSRSQFFLLFFKVFWVGH